MALPLRKLLLLLTFSVVFASAQDAENITDCIELDSCYEKCAEDDEKCMEKCEEKFSCPQEDEAPLG